MKSKILMSLLIIGVASIVMGMGFSAQFSDTEKSEGNLFTAGIIDLEVDCEGDTCFAPCDDPLPKLFFRPAADDIKPGHTGEVTISLHLKENSNPAELWMKITNITDDPGLHSEPEDEVDPLPECIYDISNHIDITVWIDHGCIPGWQGKDEDPQEGNNILDSRCEKAYYEGTLRQAEDLEFCCISGVPCTTYYIGFAWEFQDVGNEYQGDFCTFDVIFGADQP
jgi:hypothetical protein